MTGRRRRRRQQLLYDVKETRGYWTLKEESLDRNLLRTDFGRGYGYVRRQNTVLSLLLLLLYRNGCVKEVSKKIKDGKNKK